jgi:hypothetical protein
MKATSNTIITTISSLVIIMVVPEKKILFISVQPDASTVGNLKDAIANALVLKER